jgi:hypothetical protein
VSAGWIDAVAFVDVADVPLFEHVLERATSGLDATCTPFDVLGVDLQTDEDEALFRVSLLNEGTMRDMQRIETRRYAVSPRLTGEVHRCLVQKAFEGAVAPLTMARLELRDEAALYRLGAGLADERGAFGGRFPALHVY